MTTLLQGVQTKKAPVAQEATEAAKSEQTYSSASLSIQPTPGPSLPQFEVCEVTNDEAQEPQTIPTRPGCSRASLEANKVRFVSADEAYELCGVSAPGTWFPYHDVGWKQVMDGGREYGRLRFEHVLDDRKYHQRAGSKVHAYFPLNVKPETDSSMLGFTEGEAKAISQAEQGFNTIGLGGFWSFATKDENDNRVLLPDIQKVLDELSPRQVIFWGDNDTTLNPDFPFAVCCFSKLVGMPVLLPRIPLNEPKGIDDCIEKYGAEARQFIDKLIQTGIIVTPTEAPASVAYRLLEHDKESLEQGHYAGFDKDKLQRRLVDIGAAHLDNPIAHDKISKIACKVLGITKSIFTKTCNERKAQKAAETKVAPPPCNGLLFDGDVYYRQEKDAAFHSLCRRDAELHLRINGFNPKADGGFISEADRELYRIQTEQRVNYAGPLCGRPAGIHSENGLSVLATKSPVIISASKGDPRPMFALLSNLLGKSAGNPHWKTQLLVFLLWLKRARSALFNPTQHLPGQALLLIGPKDCGKTLLQTLVSHCLGGRSTDTSLWLQNKSPFNGELWEVEHLTLSDTNIDDSPSARKNLRDRIKEVVANPLVICHRKHRDAHSMRPIWRLTLSANDDPDSSFILPELDDSLADKVLLFKCYQPPVPFPTATTEAAKEFFDGLLTALPAFLYLVDNYACSPELSKGRFGVKEFHHPDIVELIQSGHSDSTLAEVLDDWMHTWGTSKIEQPISTGDLFNELSRHPTFFKNCSCPKHLGHQMRRLAATPNWSGRIAKTSFRKGDNRSEIRGWIFTKTQAAGTVTLPVAPATTKNNTGAVTP